MIRRSVAPVLLVAVLAAAPALAPSLAHAAITAPTAAANNSAKAVPVLGRKGLFAPNGVGWGTSHPHRVYNGGDWNGDVRKIDWTHWGKETAAGLGRGHTFKPHGGYYRKAVKVQFRASHLGTCSTGGPRAYTHLIVRFQTKPGSAKWGKWVKWAGLKTICRRVYTR